MAAVTVLVNAGLAGRRVGATGRCLTPRGTIRKIVADRGFGFIRTAEGKDLFFHRSALQGVDYKVNLDSLREGQQVEYEVGKGSDGRSQATRVRLASPGSK